MMPQHKAAKTARVRRAIRHFLPRPRTARSINPIASGVRYSDERRITTPLIQPLCHKAPYDDFAAISSPSGSESLQFRIPTSKYP